MSIFTAVPTPSKFAPWVQWLKGPNALAVAWLSLGVAWLRLPDLHYIARSLWAEDGTVFLAGAWRGWLAVFQPYAGYEHFFQRIVASVAVCFEPGMWPALFFAGWCLGVWVATALIAKRLIAARANRWVVLAVMVLLFLQPHSGEVFYSLVNVHWILGVALAVDWLVADPHQTRCGQQGFQYGTIRFLLQLWGMGILALSGPFSVLMAPLVALKAYWLPEQPKKIPFYVVFGLGVLVQLICLWHSDRAPMRSMDGDGLHWFKAILRFFKFGRPGFDLIFVGLAVLFWGVVGWGIRQQWQIWRKTGDAKAWDGNLLLLFAVMLFAATLFLLRFNPLLLSPLDDGARYYFPVYALALLGGFQNTHGFRRARAMLLLSFAGLSALSFQTLNRLGTPWSAFVRFAEIHPGVIIPFQPFGGTYPNWHVVLPEKWVHPEKMLGRVFTVPGLLVDEDKEKIRYIFQPNPACLVFPNQGIEVLIHQEIASQMDWVGQRGEPVGGTNKAKGPSAGAKWVLPAGLSRFYWAERDDRINRWVLTLAHRPSVPPIAEFYCFSD